MHLRFTAVVEDVHLPLLLTSERFALCGDGTTYPFASWLSYFQCFTLEGIAAIKIGVIYVHSLCGHNYPFLLCKYLEMKFDFLMFAILMHMKYHFIIVLIHISLKTSRAELLYKYWYIFVLLRFLSLFIALFVYHY